jgi:hypothetical protein
MANNPTLLKMPLATDGERATIPETTGSTTGNFSQQYGFQQINALPLQAGGIAPKREDFNGAFFLLGGVAFYAQKGWTFYYDSTQDYYLGCVVIDPADGNRYECIADMPAGTVEPHADTENDYWHYYALGDINDKADCNFGNVVYHRDEITTSGTYTAPVTGLYKITVKGGGGGGGGGGKSSNNFVYTGAGGGEGGTTFAWEHITAGTEIPVIIGAGGAGGAVNTVNTDPTIGNDGGDSQVTVNNVTYTGGHGQGAGRVVVNCGGVGGSGTIPGAQGGSSHPVYYTSFTRAAGASGGGADGSCAGGGGDGGSGVVNTGSSTSGYSGYGGYVCFEYYTPGA